MLDRKFASTRYQTQNHQVMSQRASPMSHLDGALPMDTPTRNPVDLVRIVPSNSRTGLLHYTTEPHRTPTKLLNSLPNTKCLTCSKLKALADDIINVIEKLKYVLRGVENIVEKGKCIFSFPTMFSKDFFLKVVKSKIVW